MTTFDNLHRLEPSAMIQKVFIVGGWNNNNYIKLKNKINIICDKCNRGMKENNSFLGRLLRAPEIILNLIGFNLPEQKPDGKDKEDDDPNNYILDSTLVYDRSSIPHTFIIWQYAGQDKSMNDPRSDSLIQAIYEFDPTSKRLRACICSTAYKSPHYDDFF